MVRGTELKRREKFLHHSLFISVHFIHSVIAHLHNLLLFIHFSQYCWWYKASEALELSQGNILFFLHFFLFLPFFPKNNIFMQAIYLRLVLFLPNFELFCFFHARRQSTSSSWSLFKWTSSMPASVSWVHFTLSSIIFYYDLCLGTSQIKTNSPEKKDLKTPYIIM